MCALAHPIVTVKLQNSTESVTIRFAAVPAARQRL